MPNSARQFVLWSVGLAAVLAGGLALLNFWVDPYDRYGNNRFGVYISAEREYKTTQVKRYEHNALLIGNSRIVGIPPSRLEGFRFFNAAFAGANAEEVYYYLNRFARKQQLVVIGVDLGMSDPAELHGDIFAPPGLSLILGNLFNLQTVEYSFRTMWDHFNGVPNPMGADGSTDLRSWIHNVDRDDPALFNYRLEQMKNLWGKFRCPPKEKLSFYARTAACLRERGIACVVVLPPMHEYLLEYIRDRPAKRQLELWKAELKSIFPYVVDLADSQYSAAASYYRTDPVHFKPEVGVALMNAEVLPLARRAVLAGSAPLAGHASSR